MSEENDPMAKVIKLKGLQEIAAHLRVGTKQVALWIADKNSGIPVTKFNARTYHATGAALDVFYARMVVTQQKK